MPINAPHPGSRTAIARLALHDFLCERGELCAQRQMHADVAQALNAREVLRATSVDEVADVLHTARCALAVLGQCKDIETHRREFWFDAQRIYAMTRQARKEA